MARAPAKAAPVTIPMADISSSAWITVPPSRGSSFESISMIFVAGVIG